MGFYEKENCVNIFIIDDDHISRNLHMLICQMINDVNVYGCESGEDAVSLAATVTPHVVVMDYYLPGINGAEAAKRIIELYPPAIVIGVTSDDDLELEKQMFSSGTVSHVTKPVRKDNLLFLLRNLVDMARSKSGELSADKPQKTTKNSYCKVVEVKGYDDIMLINREIEQVEIRRGITRSTMYIRAFSFLYDILVKTFMNNQTVMLGIIMDSERILILLENIDILPSFISSGVFHDTVSPFITTDDEWHRVLLDIKSVDFEDCESPAPARDLQFIRADSISGGEFAARFALSERIVEKLHNIAKLSEEYAPALRVFEFLIQFINTYTSSFELELKLEIIDDILMKIDRLIVDFIKPEALMYTMDKRFEAENDIFTEVLKLQIILHKYRKI